MTALRVVVVDDERPARARLRRMLAAIPDVEVVDEAGSADDAVRAIRRAQPDLVFLDVQMPGTDGFGVVERLEPGERPRVVFVTAHDAFAVRAFEVSALDYLLKPVDPARLAQAVERARRAGARDEADGGSERIDQLLRTLGRGAARFLERVVVTEEGKSFFVPLEHVLWVESDRNYVVLHAGTRSFTVRGTLQALEEKLDPERWVRINRSQVVRVDAIAHVEPWFHGEYHVVLRDGTKTTWSRHYLDRAEELLGRPF